MSALKADIRWCARAAFFLSVTWSLYYIEPVWQFVGRAVRWCMSRKDVTAALDRRDETGGDLIVVHTRGQGINRRLPLRMMNFLCDPIVSNDPCVVLRQRYEDEYASAVLCAGNST